MKHFFPHFIRLADTDCIAAHRPRLNRMKPLIPEKLHAKNTIESNMSLKSMSSHMKSLFDNDRLALAPQ